MANTFESVASQMIADHGTSSEDNSKENVSSDQAPGSSGASAGRSEQVAAAVAELEKLEKFRFQGQDWTAKDLEKAILRQKDYTQKTQSLSDERKSFGEESKYYENLAWDLIALRNDPSLIDKFISIYPHKFHDYAAKFINQGVNSAPTQGQQQPGQGKVPDVQTLSRLDRLEKSYNEQEVQKNEGEIKRVMDSLSAKYPDAGNFKEMVLGRAFEAHQAGIKANPDFKLTEQVWEDIFKQVDGQVSSLLKAKYGDLVKKQQEANAKSKDVKAGGGTVGAAPRKFKNLGEVTNFAVQDLTGKGR